MALKTTLFLSENDGGSRNLFQTNNVITILSKLSSVVVCSKI
jgi:hypothetical protein